MEAIMSFLAVNFDLPILEWIQANLQCGFLDFIMPIITLFGEGGIFWIAWAVILLFFPKTRKIGWSMGAALILGVLVCNVTLKPLIARPRPYDFQLAEFGKEIKLLIDAQHDFSFPSGHTIACFEASVVLLFIPKYRKVGWSMGVALILGLLVCNVTLKPLVHRPRPYDFQLTQFGK